VCYYGADGGGLLQAFAQLGEEFEPLLIGCQENRRNWQIMADDGTPEHGDRDTIHCEQDKDDNRRTQDSQEASTSLDIDT